MKSEWEDIGVIGVDAGVCWIGDPCYFVGFEDKKTQLERSGITDWYKFCEKIESSAAIAKQFNYPAGHPGLGVCASTGYGDGTYTVQARFVNVDNWGRRIAEIRVVFIEDDEI